MRMDSWVTQELINLYLGSVSPSAFQPCSVKSRLRTMHSLDLLKGLCNAPMRVFSWASRITQADRKYLYHESRVGICSLRDNTNTQGFCSFAYYCQSWGSVWGIVFYTFYLLILVYFSFIIFFQHEQQCLFFMYWFCLVLLWLFIAWFYFIC